MIRELSFVELTVANWPAAVAWYRDILGLDVMLHIPADEFAILEAKGGRIALKAGTPRPGTVLLTFAVDDLLAALDRLAALDVPLEAPLKASPEGYRRVLLRDPDGYLMCLYDWDKSFADRAGASGPHGIADPSEEIS
jgi:catechol 2,3-dioxygenase-like lactoylglutathione lyase family enzyme